MRKYDKEFKQQAVKKYLDGQAVASISRKIGVSENTIHTGLGNQRFCKKVAKQMKIN
jgi:transposase-like protein